MSFLNPFLLFALASVAVPLLIHLIQLQRPQRIRFSTLQFFEALRKTTVRRIRLKEYVLLFLRMAALACFAMVLARPFIPSSFFGGSQGVTYLLVIDNSPGMRQMDDEGTWFSKARDAAAALISQAGERSLFIIVPTHSPISQTEPVSAAEALRLINALEPSDSARRVEKQLTYLFRERMDSDAPLICYWFGDLQKSSFSAWEQRSDPPFRVPVNVINVGSDPASNATITNLIVLSSILSERRPVQFEATVKQYGSEKLVNAFLSLEVNGSSVGQYSFGLEPGEEKKFVFEWTPPDGRPAEIAAVLEGDPWIFDNRRYLSLALPAQKNILVIEEKLPAGEKPFYTRALDVASRLDRTLVVSSITPDAITEQAIRESAAIILNGLKSPQGLPVETIREHIQSGRSLLFLPGNQSDAFQWNDFTGAFSAGGFDGFRGEFGSFKPVAAVQKPDAALPVLENVFDLKDRRKLQVEMPSLFYFWLYKRPEQALPILETEDGLPLLSEQRVGQGSVFISAFGVEPGWSDFPAKAFYPVFWFRMLQWMSQKENTAVRSVSLGSPLNAAFPMPGNEITLQGTGFSIKPQVTRIAAGVQIYYDGLDWKPGHYRLVSEEKTIGLTVNPDPLESNFETFSAQDAEPFISKMFQQVEIFDHTGFSEGRIPEWLERSGKGTELWRFFAVAGLLLLLAEMAVSRLYKTQASG